MAFMPTGQRMSTTPCNCYKAMALIGRFQDTPERMCELPIKTQSDRITCFSVAQHQDNSCSYPHENFVESQRANMLFI